MRRLGQNQPVRQQHLCSPGRRASSALPSPIGSCTYCSWLRYTRRVLAQAPDPISRMVKMTMQRGERPISILLHTGLRAHDATTSCPLPLRGSGVCVSRRNMPERQGVIATHTLASPPLVRMACLSYVRSSRSWTTMCHPSTTSAVALPPPAAEGKGRLIFLSSHWLLYFFAVYSLSMPYITWRCTCSNPTQPSTSRIVLGGTHHFIVSQ